MPDYIQQSFNGGELSPKILGRVDYEKYVTGAKLLRNWVPTPQGPLQNRPGTEFISDEVTSGLNIKLVPFQYGIDDAYILNFGYYYINVYKNGAIISTQEMIRNGNMEEDLYWYNLSTPTTNERSQAYVNQGSYSRYFVTTGAGQGIASVPAADWLTNYFNLVDGVDYNLSIDVRPSVTSIRVRVQYYSAGWNDEYDNTFAGLTAGSWQTITDSFTAAANRTYCRIIIESSVAAGAGNFYVDAVSLEKQGNLVVITPFTGADVIFGMDYAQSADDLYIASNSYFPRELQRYADNAWFFDYHDAALAIRDIYYKWTSSPSAANEFYLTTIDGADPTINKPKDIHQGFNPVTSANNTAFTEGTLGSLNVGEWAYGDNDTLGYDTIYIRITASADPDTLERWSLWAENWPAIWDQGSYPRTVVFHGDSLVWGGHTLHPQTFVKSQSSIYNDYTYDSLDPTDSDGLELTLNYSNADAIMFMRELSRLVAMTISREVLLTGTDGSSIITANSKWARKGSGSGSSAVRPVDTGKSMIHCVPHAKKIDVLTYDYDSDSFGSEDLFILAEHLTRHYAIIDMAYQAEPYKILWALRSDGTLLSLTYIPEQKVFAWAQHRIAGTHSISGHPTVKSIATIPGSGYDELWMIIQREINGAYVNYIERLAPFFVKPDHGADYFMDDDTTDAIFLDSYKKAVDTRQDISTITLTDPAVVGCAGHGYADGNTVRIRSHRGLLDSDGVSLVNGFDFTVAGALAGSFELQLEGDDLDATGATASGGGGTVAKPTTAVTGLDHLEGESVSVVGDGNYLGEYTVAAGAITLAVACSVVYVGLRYDCDMETITPKLQNQYQSLDAHEKSIKAITLRLIETTGLSYGPDEDNLIALEWFDDSIPYGHPPRLFDGDKDEKSFSGTHETSPTVYIRQEEPMPATISAIMLDIDIGA